MMHELDGIRTACVISYLAPVGRRRCPALIAECPVCRRGNRHIAGRGAGPTLKTGACGHAYLLPAGERPGRGAA